MDQLIPILNKLQDIFSTINTTPIDLPQIVVIGSQSSGKSSVLENIVRKDFLPRGSGIVTRRPLILQCIHNPKTNEGEKAIFLHRPNEVFTDFSKVRDEIKRETDRTAGTNKGIKSSPINLKISSPHVLNLTLVDLPGITRVPVGDQPSNIEVMIRRMVLQYITPANTLILAVTAANTDLANSDALHLAREVDPDGERTVGVLTKVDLMDRGTDVIDVLSGNLIPLKHGYVAIVNRSQQDIIKNKPLSLALQSERDFFARSPPYKPLTHRCGTHVLTKLLNSLLIHHIKHFLPELKLKLHSKIEELEEELKHYGDTAYDIPLGAAGPLLLRVITLFCDKFRAIVDGRSSAVTVIQRKSIERRIQPQNTYKDLKRGSIDSFDQLNQRDIIGGARINMIFNRIFSPSLQKIWPLENISSADIRTCVRNASGPRTGMFVPEVAFEYLAKRQIALLGPTCLKCIDLVKDELEKMVLQTESDMIELARFENLKEALSEAVNAVIKKHYTPCHRMINNLISIHTSYINTNNPEFLEKMQIFNAQFEPSQSRGLGTNSSALNDAQSPYQQAPAHYSDIRNQKGIALGSRLPQVPTLIQVSNTPTTREVFDTQYIQHMLETYFLMVRKIIQDTVPKSVIHFLVNAVVDNLQNELVTRLYSEQRFPHLMKEAPGISERRKKCQELLDVLKKAQKVVNEFRLEN